MLGMPIVRQLCPRKAEVRHSILFDCLMLSYLFLKIIVFYYLKNIKHCLRLSYYWRTLVCWYFITKCSKNIRKENMDVQLFLVKVACAVYNNVYKCCIWYKACCAYKWFNKAYSCLCFEFISKVSHSVLCKYMENPIQ